MHGQRAGRAHGDVEALVIPPDKLRALLIAEAELGERIMRALILRRIGLLEVGSGGPIIIGRPSHGDVLRLANFLRRNGHPHQILDPESDAEALALIDRFHIDPGRLPIVLCPGGQLAVPAVGPGSAPGKYTLYSVSWDGRLRQVNVADLRD